MLSKFQVAGGGPPQHPIPPPWLHIVPWWRRRRRALGGPPTAAAVRGACQRRRCMMYLHVHGKTHQPHHQLLYVHMQVGQNVRRSILLILPVPHLVRSRS